MATVARTNDGASLLNEESHVSRRLQLTVLMEKCCRRFRSNVLPLFRELCGEFVGTFLAILIIITVAATQTLLDAAGGLWQVAVVSGLGVSLSIYATGHVSGSHINPAVTVAFALVRWKLFSWKKVIPYIVVQIAAGFFAGSMLYALYSESIDLFEKRNHIVRGSDESVRTAMIFGEYFPHPGFAVVKNGSSSAAAMVVSPLKAMAIEAWATGILVFVIFSSQIDGLRIQSIQHGPGKETRGDLDHDVRDYLLPREQLPSYREIGGQKDYAVFGHCVIRCP